MLVESVGNAWLEHSRAVQGRMRVLVVDDDPGARDLLDAVLRDGGFDVDLASSAEDAWQALQDAQYGLLVADNQLPGQSGIELIERVRHSGIDLAPVMITGHATIENISAAMRAGAADYIPKPVPDMAQLILRLRSIVERRLNQQFYASLVRELSQAVKSGGQDRNLIVGVARDLFIYKRELKSRKAVLVADPEPMEAEVLADVLGSAGLSVSTVTTLGQALAGLAPAQAPLAAVINLNLPDAIPLIRDLRLRDGPIGVIVLSGVGELEQVLEALEAGAGDYVNLAAEGLDVLWARVARAVDNVRREYLYAHLIATLYHHVKDRAPERADTLLHMIPSGHRYYIEKMPVRPSRRTDDAIEVEIQSVLEPHRDRRAHTRLPFLVPATVRVEGGEEAFPCRTRDVSESGMFLHSPHLPRQRGAVVTVTLETERRMVIHGEVVRLVHVQPDPMRLSGWGVRVLNPLASGYAAMVRELLQLEEPALL